MSLLANVSLVCVYKYLSLRQNLRYKFKSESGHG
jgi:hypothetical protein